MNIHSIYRRISPMFRRKRMAQFLARLRPGATDKILDIGGYPYCWAEAEVAFPVRIVNIDVPPGMDRWQPQISMEYGDATKLTFGDRSFDLAYSNSVIEHLGTWENQLAFAKEARRVARKLWVQTPARWFPIEPHLIAPFVHYLPKAIQKHLLRRATVWGWMTRPTPAAVDQFLKEVRLLTMREMKQLFPDCVILRERILGLTKSYIAVRDSI
jgi:hypothetical protein